MNLFELIVAIIIFMILIIDQSTLNNQYHAEFSPKTLKNILSNLQVLAITYKKPIHICGISVNKNNHLLHNCNNNQQDWSYGILAYIDYSNSGHYNEKYENEKLYLFIINDLNSKITNSCNSELIVNSSGRFINNCTITIDNKIYNTSMVINTQGNIEFQY
jgi:hypothetical protein